MTLFTDLKKDMLAVNQGGEVQVHTIFELLCNLIDLKLDRINLKLEHLEKGLIAQTDYTPQKD